MLVVLSLFMVSSRDGATETLAEMDQRALSEAELMAQLSESSPQLVALLTAPEFPAIVHGDPGTLDYATKQVQSPYAGENQMEGDETTGGLGAMMIPLQLLGAPFLNR